MSERPPDSIWLQCNDPTGDGWEPGTDVTSGEVTWCWHQIHETDEEYIHGSIVAGLSQAAAEVVARYGGAKAMKSVQRLADVLNRTPIR